MTTARKKPAQPQPPAKPPRGQPPGNKLLLPQERWQRGVRYVWDRKGRGK